MEWFHTLVLVIHVLGAALIIGTAFVGLFVQLKKPPVAENLKLIGQLYNLVRWVFVTQLLSGLYLAWNEWDKFAKSPLLGAKFTLFVIAAALATVMLGRAKKKAQAGEAPTPNTTWAWVSLLIFLTIATLGVILAESAG